MALLPDKLGKSPLREAILEIRYSSNFPADAIFGVLYASIKDFFPQLPVQLPILEIPASLRAQDPNFKYQAHHRLIKDNIVLNIGPRVLSFANQTPYDGWTGWSTFVYDALEKILATNVLDDIERVGLRYINLFDGNIFDKVKLEVKVDNKVLRKESTNLRTEIIDGRFIKILQVANAVNVQKNDTISNNSVIDIDCLYNVDDNGNFVRNYKITIEEAHNKVKELFFSLLKSSFLDELEPNSGGTL
jgi:uncharacterized protein (TIGR04255 family)